MPPAASARISNAQYSTQDIWAGVLAGVPTPVSGISPLQRLANMNPPNFRIHAGTDGGAIAVDLPFNAPYTSSDGIPVAAWDFIHLNSLVLNTVGRVAAPIMLNVRYAPDNMFAGSGPMGGNGNAQGALVDQSYAAFATYMANLVRYYNTSPIPPPVTGMTPWPKPAGVGPIRYWEIWNEPDFSSENPRIPPSLPAPAQIALSGVNVVGGRLIPGATYAYQLTSITSTNQESRPSSALSLTLPSGANAIKVTWGASTNLSRVAAAYRIYGRTVGSAQQMVVVGKNAPGGRVYTDDGTVTPANGAPPASDTTPGGAVFSPLEYKALWDMVVPAMKAVDPSIKVVGPVATNPISLSPQSVITTGVTTGPSDGSYLDTRDFVQVLMTSANRPDVISYHAYGGWQGAADTDSGLMSRIDGIVADLQTNVLPYAGTTPVWHTEANVNAGEDTRNRPALAFGAAWDASLFAKLAPLGISTINQFTYVNSPSFGLITEPGSPVVGAVAGNPYLPYWVAYWIDQLFFPGAKILSIANVPAGVDVLAIADPPDFTRVKVLVVNRQVPAASSTLTLQLAGIPSLATRARVIDSSTNLINGPSVSSLGAVSSLSLTLNGFSVGLAEFDTPPVVVSAVTPNVGPLAGGTPVTIAGINLSQATAVYFGALAAPIVSNTGSVITTTSPATTTPGPVDVTVTTPNGTSPATAADQFIYGSLLTKTSSSQFALANGDGTTWQDLDPSGGLSLTVAPSTDSLAVLTGNVDLWTATAGVNQDLGIYVSPSSDPGNIVAWKESGGFAGTFSPNAAAVQTAVRLSAGTTYVVKLQWKTNRSAPGSTIFAGAGPWPASGTTFSPSTLTTRLVPLTDGTVFTAVSTQQYWLANSTGTSWSDVDTSSGTPLTLTVTPPSGSWTALITGNIDLWTATAGFNQDVGINVSEANATQYPGNIVAWKESGGFAGTFSPNAAMVEGGFAMTGGTLYHVKLQWKTNRPGTSTIFAGAGPWPANTGLYSPNRLTVQLIPTGPTMARAVSRSQATLVNSDGATWQDLSLGGAPLTIAPPSNCIAVLSANADLWTANAGVNQDLGISVTPSGAPGNIVAWKESGGFNGTFSPNAAYVTTTVPVTSGTTYSIKLQWKANRLASGRMIVAGAGPWPNSSTLYSPTSLTAALVC
jgi:hypothetical protein